MSMYRKKPVVIEARQLLQGNIKEVYEWVHSTEVSVSNAVSEGKWDDYCDLVIRDGMTIFTLEDGIDKRAKHVATIGDYIIKGVKGEFYPCKPDIFEMTYEPATNATTELADELLSQYSGKGGVIFRAAEELKRLGQEAGDDTQVLYVYRYSDGRTQVRAPHINDPALVIDMLEQALEAMHNGRKVETQ